MGSEIKRGHGRVIQGDLDGLDRLLHEIQGGSTTGPLISVSETNIYINLQVFGSFNPHLVAIINALVQLVASSLSGTDLAYKSTIILRDTFD